MTDERSLRAWRRRRRADTLAGAFRMSLSRRMTADDDPDQLDWSKIEAHVARATEDALAAARREFPDEPEGEGP